MQETRYGGADVPQYVAWILAFLTIHVGVEAREGGRDGVQEGSLGGAEKEGFRTVNPMSAEMFAATEDGEGRDTVGEHNILADIKQADLSVAAPLDSPRLVSCRLLLSLSALDSLSWCVGRAMQFESLYIAERIGLSYVSISVILTTVEVMVEFLASACSPLIYQKLQGSSTFTSRNLAEATLKAYWFSCLIAVVIYPAFGVLMWIVFEPSLTFLVALVCIQSFQYAFLNQVGDALREMAQPQWLLTFHGYDMVFPGRAWGFRRPATPDCLALYLQLSFLLIAVFFGAIYTVAEDNDVIRWCATLFIAAINLGIITALLKHKDKLSSHVVDNVTEDDAPLVIWPSKMKRYEIALISLIVLMFAVPEQAENAIVAVLLLELDGFFQTGLLVIGGMVVFLFLVYRIKREPVVAPVHADDPEAASVKNYWVWIAVLVGILATLIGSAIGLYAVLGTVGLLVAIAGFVVLRPLQVQLVAMIDSFLFIYQAQRASNIRFWVNVLGVLVSGPILALNWFAIEGGLDGLGIRVVVFANSSDFDETNPEEQRQAAVVLFLSIFLIGISTIYYALIDPFLCSNSASLKYVIDNVPKDFDT